MDLADSANARVSDVLAALAALEAGGGNSESGRSSSTSALLLLGRQQQQQQQHLEDWSHYSELLAVLAEDERMSKELSGASGSGGGGGGSGVPRVARGRVAAAATADDEEDDGAGKEHTMRGGAFDGDDDDEEEEEASAAAAGHRHLRVRVSDLERRIEALRADPGKRAELQERIEKYKAERRAQAAKEARAGKLRRQHVTENKAAARAMTREAVQEHIREGAARHEERMARTAEMRQRIAEERSRLRLAQPLQLAAVAGQQQQLLAIPSTARHVRVLSGRERKAEVALNWLALAQIAAHALAWRGIVEEDRAARAEAAKHDRAATVIQRFYRQTVRAREARDWRQRMAVVMRVLRRHVVRWRLARKNHAADVLRRFLGDVQEVTRVTRAVRRFRFCVLQVQASWRRCDEVRQAQLNLLTRQWQAAEAERARSEWERTAQAQPQATSSLLWGSGKQQQQQQQPRKLAATTATTQQQQRRSRMLLLQKPAGSGGGKEISILDSKARRVPDAIRLRLLSQVLSQSKRAFLAETRRYNQAIQKLLEEEEEEEEQASSPLTTVASAGEEQHPQQQQQQHCCIHRERPPHPVFKVLLREEDMAALIERGIAIAQQERADALAHGKPAPGDEDDDYDDGW